MGFCILAITSGVKAAIRAENNELIFLDGKGKVLNKIKSGPENGPSQVEERQVKRMSRHGIEYAFKQQIARDSAISKNGKVAIVNESHRKFLVSDASKITPEDDNDDIFNQTIPSHLEYYDENGALKWKKEMREKMTL
jgi:hypothetical protein